MWTSIENTYTVLQSFSLSTVLYVLVFTLMTKYIMDLFRSNPRLAKFAAKLPGPPALPIVGNGNIGLSAENTEITHTLMKYEQKYGSRYRLWFGKDLVVVLSDLKDVQTVFGSAKMLNHPQFMKEPTHEYWGDGLFGCPLPVWKITRKRVEPYFNNKAILSKHVSEFNDVIYKHVKNMEKHINGPEFDLLDSLPHLSFNIITKMLFDTEFDSSEISDLQLDYCFALAEDVWLAKVFKPWTQFKLLDYFIFKEKKDYFHARMIKMVDTLLKKTPSEAQLMHESSHSEKQKFSFLATLFQNKEELGLPQQYIRDEIVNQIAGGTHATAITLSFCLLALAIHPQVQDKLYNELFQVFGEDDRRADINDVDHLPYLNQVLKETERRFALVPVFFRGVDVDTTIGPYTYPSGTAIMIPVRNIHWSSEYYANPLEFDPEHFSPEVASSRPKLAFIPFGTGARGCPGKTLAELEIKLTLTALLRKFSFHTTMKMDDVKLTSGNVATSVNGFKVSIKLRR